MSRLIKEFDISQTDSPVVHSMKTFIHQGLNLGYEIWTRQNGSGLISYNNIPYIKTTYTKKVYKSGLIGLFNRLLGVYSEIDVECFAAIKNGKIHDEKTIAESESNYIIKDGKLFKLYKIQVQFHINKIVKSEQDYSLSREDFVFCNKMLNFYMNNNGEN